MLGSTAVMRGSASVYVEGELWSARAVDGSQLPAEGNVRVMGREGMTLIVEPLDGAGDTQQ